MKHARRWGEALLVTALCMGFWSCGEDGEDEDTLSREEALDLGTFTQYDRTSGYLFAAPHGGYDLKTEVIAESYCDAVSWNCLIADGYRSGDRTINVNRPTEGVGVPKDEEKKTKAAKYVYSKFEKTVNDLKDESLKLYVEIHGNSREKSKGFIEVATVGVGESKKDAVRGQFDAALKEAGITDLEALMEGDEGFHYGASASKDFGILSEVNPALHLEVPNRYRTDETNRKALVDFLKQALPAVAEAHFP